MGKSAILSAWLARREAAGAVVPHHFVRRQVADWDQPEVIAVSLAAQIEAAFPTRREPEAKPERRLLELLGRVSRQLGARGRLLVLVDGLDETRASPGDNPLPRFLPHVLPSGIRFLCATRPTYPHLNWLEARGLVWRLDLDDRRWSTSNEAVVRGFWETAATGYQPPLPEATVSVAVSRAEGNVLHAVMLHDALRVLPANERHIERIPRGLKSLVGEIWDRAASHGAMRTGLGILCAAQEALSLEVLAELVGWEYEDKEHFVRDARQLLLEEPASWGGAEAYRPRHDWVREVITERLGPAALRTHHQMFCRTLASWVPSAEPPGRRYMLRHALIHRVEAADWQASWQLATDMSFLEAKCRELGPHEAEADLSRAAERCHAAGKDALARRLSGMARALARESHWLRTAPEATAAIVWNRLRRFGWSTEELDRELNMPARLSFLRVRSAAARESSALIRDLLGHTGAVNACAIAPDGWRMVSASDDRTLKVWDLDSGRILASCEGHSGRVAACAVTPDGRYVVSGSDDRTLRLWEFPSGRAVATLEGHEGKITACIVTPDGKGVVSASSDRTLKVWDLESRRTLATLGGHAGRVTACAVTPDGNRVVSASWDRTLRIWRLEDGCLLRVLVGHADEVVACAITPDGQRVVSASWDRTLRVWDLDSGDLLVVIVGHQGGVTNCVVTPDGRRVVSASWDRTLRVWDLDTGEALATFDGHTAEVTACAVTPNNQRLISASHDGSMKLWDLSNGHTATPIERYSDEVISCVATPDGKFVVSISRDEAPKLWHAEQGEVLMHLDGGFGPATVCTISSDSRFAIVGYRSGMLARWRLQDGSLLAKFEGNGTSVTACAMTPDDRYAISIAYDEILKTWNIKAWDINDGMAVASGKREIYAVRGKAVFDVPNRDPSFILESWICRISRRWIRVVCTVISGSIRIMCVIDDFSTSERDLARLETDLAKFQKKYRAALIEDRIEAQFEKLEKEFGKLLNRFSKNNKSLSNEEIQTYLHFIMFEEFNRSSLFGMADSKGGYLEIISSSPEFLAHSDRVLGCMVASAGEHVFSWSLDRTLRLWDARNMRLLATMEGHVAGVAACAISHDGRHVVSASHDRTLKIWDLQTYACIATHHGEAPYSAVAVTDTGIVAGDRAGGVWFLDWPRGL